ncbi:unnamed protein product [Spirodela intermedia]|uniref:Uncharacterized protein n=1 Tax=Spirodela intermedia TaxID=51605 RepID=A0A7I8IDW7_SPIIN|nr:unnamed protein product [Spirodela intermedia]CAA6655273.1 unnamed protein product [Spirodela intermedia]
MEYIQNCFNEESTSIPSVPPGFASSKSFTLERIDDDTSGSYVAPASVTLQTKINGQQTSAGEEKFSKCLRQRPCINYSQFDNSSDEESDSELPAQGAPSVCCLPKGTVRGCPECSNCQKVTARWRPEEACRPIINDAPIFYPTEEEFEDTLKYIASIRPKAEFYGICLIVPPLPCLGKLQIFYSGPKNRQAAESIFCKKIDREQLRHEEQKEKLMKTESGLGKVDAHSMELNGHVERFGFEPGPEFTLKSFESYADDFKEQYFRIKESDNWSERKPSVEVIEGEYWRMVEKPTEEIEVLYGADIETGSFGSGFPKMSSDSTNSSVDDKYVKSGWNLNNFPRLTGSVLAFEDTDISGVLVPWLYVGMCFSSFCWHVEDHHFYSLNYMHWGAPKVWYGVPGGDALKLETAMKKHLPDLFEEQPDLLHNLVTQFSPSILKSEGVPVFRCVQNRGQFVLTFPRAYHSGFNCGFNCAEAVNFAVELYRGQMRKISVSHDKLLLGAAREAVRAQWNILFLGKKSPDNLRWKNARIDTEHTRRENLCSSSQSRKMDANFDADTERECSICHYDLHLSAVGCSCSSERFACLEHGNEMCACTWNMRIFLFRYEISELNVLLDAVGGKLSAVHRWALSDLGLSLSHPSNCERDQVLETPETDASVMDDTDINLGAMIKKVDNMSNSHVRVKDQGKDEITMLHSSLLTDQSSATEFSQGTISTKNSASKHVANQIQEYLASKQVGDSDNSIVGTMLLPSQFHVSVNASSGKNNRTIDSSFKMAVRGQSGTVSQPVPQIGTDRYNRQGPRMAKVVRRINSVVEPLALGVVLSGQFWSCGQAIFPKGYRSRVRYFSVLDPSQMCYYVSEILDAGLLCPLFMVQVEHCPNEVFIHLSATRCWDMVRDRVNHEIRKQHSLGRTGVPAMQPPGSLDGVEMFGLTSPAIIKAIEANDADHVCSEYWKSRPRSLDPQVPEGPAADWRPTNMEAGQRATGPGMQQQLVPGADAIFRSLLRKLNPEELQSLGHALGDDGQSSKEEALKLINNEIEGRPKP